MVECKDVESSEDTLFLTRTPSQRRKRMKKFSIFDVKELLSFCNQANIHEKHVYRMWRAIVNHGAKSIETIPELPKVLQDFVNERCSFQTVTVTQAVHSHDGSTTKFLLTLFDQKQMESVIMRYGHVRLDSFPEKEGHTVHLPLSHPFRCAPRSTLCVSSQVGCSMKCAFCATGTLGLLANLTCGEILEQLYIAQKLEPIKNVVFMGMGEPLDNYEEVIFAIKLLTDVRVFHLAAHRVTISTVGVVPRLRQLKQDAPCISLALSLHAPTQKIRLKIVPTAKVWPIESILHAAIDFTKGEGTKVSGSRKNRKLLIEYVMIQNINVSAPIAHLLGEFLKSNSDWIHVNLIPYNPNFLPGTRNMQAPTDQEVSEFVTILRSYTLKVTIRQTLGQVSNLCDSCYVLTVVFELGYFQCLWATCDWKEALKHAFFFSTLTLVQ
ncbi:probable dual-specificity RNA methyltransferase RlmN isoform X2 [Hylaeus volcanicus]|uniref:probable dual-specificity RNA methyltransferase RlmN isoform X2 n=1 Tax=Hylaeus volcanicus TaxID=313075 RepID=UPI0023B7CBF9|nr:probable dual-specificity RNA methyltransferase RlmN isoform X2 [Hylaeus volcanicus]